MYQDSWIRTATCVTLRAVTMATQERTFARLCPMYSGLELAVNLTVEQRIARYIGWVWIVGLNLLLADLPDVAAAPALLPSRLRSLLSRLLHSQGYRHRVFPVLLD